MLKICDVFRDRYSVVFNAENSKFLLCLSYNKSSRFSIVRPNPIFISVAMRLIVWMRCHMWVIIIITSIWDDAQDIMSRRFSLIGKINNILCNFRTVDSRTKLRLVKAYRLILHSFLWLRTMASVLHLYFESIYCWNSLPLSVKNFTSLCIFKTNLLTVDLTLYLIGSAFV